MPHEADMSELNIVEKVIALEGYGLEIAEQVRLQKMAEDGNRPQRFQQFHDWIAYVGRVLAARRGAESHALRRA